MDLPEDESPFVGFGPRLMAYLIDIVLTGITLGLYWFYWMYRMADRGDSVGKAAMDIVVVDADQGRNLGWGTTLLREPLGRAIVDSLFLGIGELWLLVDDDRQAIHDKVAGTYVVRTDQLDA